MRTMTVEPRAIYMRTLNGFQVSLEYIIYDLKR